jgi:hypothetical protein
VIARTSLAWRAVLTGVAVAVLGAIGAPMRATESTLTTADEPHYLLTAISLWDDRSLDVSDERAALRYRAFHEVTLPLQASVQADASQVAPHDPLLPLLLAPATGLGGWLGAKLALAALAGVLAGLVVVVAEQRFGVGPKVAVAAAVIAGASPPLAVYATQVYPELVAALALLAGVWWVTGPLRDRAVAGATAMLVALPWLSVKYAPLAVVLAAALVVALWRAGRRRAIAAVGVAGGLAAMAFLLAHQRWYGGVTAYAAGSHFQDGELTVMGADPDYLGRSIRLLGLLVDDTFGLAAWQPAALAVVPAAGAMLWRRPPGSVVVLGLLAVGWLNATFVALTMHGWWWPGRQVVVVVPLVVVVIAWWAQRAAPWVRAVLLAAGLAGVVAYGFVLVEVLAGAHSLVVGVEETWNPLRWLWRLVLPDERASGLRTTVLNALWLVALAALATVALRSAGQNEDLTKRDGLRAKSGERMRWRSGQRRHGATADTAPGTAVSTSTPSSVTSTVCSN